MLLMLKYAYHTSMWFMTSLNAIKKSDFFLGFLVFAKSIHLIHLPPDFTSIGKLWIHSIMQFDLIKANLQTWSRNEFDTLINVWESSYLDRGVSFIPRLTYWTKYTRRSRCDTLIEVWYVDLGCVLHCSTQCLKIILGVGVTTRSADSPLCALFSGTFLICYITKCFTLYEILHVDHRHHRHRYILTRESRGSTYTHLENTDKTYADV